MVWTQFASFVDAIPGDAYVSDDGWGMHKSWDDVMFDTGSAWRLYQRAKQPELGFLLLGDSKLRADPTVVHSFGLLSAAGPQEAEVRAMMAGLRWQAAMRHPALKPAGVAGERAAVDMRARALQRHAADLTGMPCTKPGTTRRTGATACWRRYRTTCSGTLWP